MRILYLSQYFPPEVGATQIRAYEMAQNWVRLGHQVTIIAEVPNHPVGVIHPSYRGKLYKREMMDGIDVIRVWVKASPTKSFSSRILFYLSYMLTAALAGLTLARGRFDVLYATSPPLFVGAAALLISTFKRLPLVFEVRDLWPESAVVLGELSNPRFIAWATRLEEACYQRARKIIVVTRGIQERLLERGYPAEKMSLITNGSNTDLFQFRPADRQRIRAELNLEGKFTLVYAGIHGLAQDLETVVEAARLLNAHDDIHFLLVGEGPRKAAIAALVEQYRLSNIRLLTEQPREIIPAYFSAADAALAPLRKLDLFKGALPVKMFDAWACARPLLLGVDGEARQVLEAAQGGIYVPPENPAALVEAILKLNGSPKMCEQMGKNGRLYTVQNFSRKALAEKLAVIVEEIIRPG